MYKQIPYASEEEKAQIIAEQLELGFRESMMSPSLPGVIAFDNVQGKIETNLKMEQQQKVDILFRKLSAASFADIDTWVDNNVQDLPSARLLFKKILVMISYLLNRE